MLKLSDSLEEMFGGVARLYNGKRLHLVVRFSFPVLFMLKRYFLFHSPSSPCQDGKSCGFGTESPS